MGSIVDSHVHRYPAEVSRDPKAWSEKMNEPHWYSLVKPRNDGFSLQGWADRDRLLRDMDQAGIEKVILLAWYWENHETCVYQNQWHRRWIKEDPDRFSAFAAVQPLAGEAALEDLRRSIDDGLCGIGELLPAVQGYSLDNEVWLQVLSYAQENKLPINLHVTEPVGRNYPGKVATPLENYYNLVRQFPDLKFIFAHWGGGMPFYELNKQCRKTLKNVYYDTAASPLLYDKRVFRAVVDLVGTEKVLFGSDYPLKLYPSQNEEPGFTHFIDDVLKSGLRDRELARVLGGNACELLGLWSKK